jgi:hypothetical protein
MTASEKRARFDEWQVFSERSKVLGIFILNLDFRFQPVSDGQQHCLNFSKVNDRNGAPPISGSPR